VPTATDSVQPADRPGVRRVFFGTSGLRAGWRALIFVICMAAFESQSGYLLKVQHDLLGEGESAAGWLFIKTVLFIYVLIVVLVIGSFEHRSLTEYGLPLRKIFGRDFWAGALWGFGLLSANFALMVLTRAYSFGTIALPTVQIVKYGVLWVAADLMVGLAEEFVFRGYLLFTLTRGMGFWPAAVLTSALFGLVHLDVQGEPWTAITNIALLSLLLCLALRRTGSLWFAIGSHMAFDWGLTFFYSCDPSARGHLLNASLHGNHWLTGGAAGPEGNIFNVFLVAGGILLFSRIYPQVKYPTTVTEAQACD
jgi:membrane protease YdiL (CAAX protease family)